MTITIYVVGVFISAGVWFLLIKFRQGGFYIPLPPKFEGNLLDPLNHKNVDWSLLMLGWFLMAVLWPVGWGLLVMFYITAWFIEILSKIWNRTIGNEELARKIFKDKK